MSLTFVAGSAHDVFPAPLAAAVMQAVGDRLSSSEGSDAYHSEPVDGRGWLQLQHRAAERLGGAAVPQLVGVEAYQAVYLPEGVGDVEHLPIANAADPLQVGSLPALLDELTRLAASESFPADEVELMQLSAHYLESDELFATDLDIQTFVQLFLSARQAAAHRQPLWIVA